MASARDKPVMDSNLATVSMSNFPADAEADAAFALLEVVPDDDANEDDFWPLVPLRFSFEFVDEEICFMSSLEFSSESLYEGVFLARVDLSDEEA